MELVVKGLLAPDERSHEAASTVVRELTDSDRAERFLSLGELPEVLMRYDQRGPMDAVAEYLTLSPEKMTFYVPLLESEATQFNDLFKSKRPGVEHSVIPLVVAVKAC